jgi:transcriptional regulator with XRE-family HTH domain
MTGTKLKQFRKQKKWTQKEAAARLGVTQAYLSLLEKGRRPVTDDLTEKAVRAFGLPAANLPVKKDLSRLSLLRGGAESDDELTRRLAALGYSGFSHIRASRLRSPAEVLITALATPKLDARLVEALPWLIWQVPEASWSKVVAAAKVRDLQNRLGFVTSLARKVAERAGDRKKAAALKKREAALADSRLFKEDTLCTDSLTETEKRWLRQNRTAEAEFWRVLSDLKAEHLDYAA